MGVSCALGAGSGGGTPPLFIRFMVSLVCWRMLAPVWDGRNNRAVNFVRDGIRSWVCKPKKVLTIISRGTDGYGGGRSLCFRVGRCRGSGGNNRRFCCRALEMFGYPIHRRSFPSVLVPALLDHLPRSFTKTNVLCVFRFCGSFTLQDDENNFWVPSHSESGPSSEHLMNNYSKGIDIRLLGNLARAQVKIVGME